MSNPKLNVIMLDTKPVIQTISDRNLSSTMRLTHCHKTDKNNKPSEAMEDFVIVEPDLLSNGEYAFFAILDGHGGAQVSNYLALHFADMLRVRIRQSKRTHSTEDIIKMAIEDAERKLAAMNCSHVGSTFCSIFIDRAAHEMIIVNLGDSKLMQVACEPNGMLSTAFLTTSHKTTNFEEVRRIMMSGGMVFNGRVGGKLNVTRSIGDFALKKFGVSSEPEVHRYSFDASSVILLASDGVWDFVNVDDVLQSVVHSCVTCEQLCDVLAQEAVKKGSRDNISIICVVAD